MGDGNLYRNLLPFERNFTQLPNAWLRDERLTWAARGILAHLMTHEKGWKVSLGALAKASPQGIDAVRSAVRLLEQTGYLRRRRGRNGQPDDWEVSDPTGTYEPALFGSQEAATPVDNHPIGKSDPIGKSNGVPVGKSNDIRTPIKNNQAPEASTDGAVDNSRWTTCVNGHRIVGVSGGGTPFCELGCAPVLEAVPA